MNYHQRLSKVADELDDNSRLLIQAATKDPRDDGFNVSRMLVECQIDMEAITNNWVYHGDGEKLKEFLKSLAYKTIIMYDSLAQSLERMEKERIKEASK